MSLTENQGSNFTTKTKLERTSYQELKAGGARKLCIHCRQYFFTALGIPEKILKNINKKYSLVFSGSYKTQFVTTPPQKSLSLHCYQINKVKNELNG